MPVTKFTENVNNIQALSDQPNTIDGLTSSELKQRFDKAGADIKTYLNNTLTEEIDDIVVATNSSITSVRNAIPTNYVTSSDSRLTNSRKCNNTFDNWGTARGNLKIGYGTSLPSSGDNGSIFLLYS